MRAFVTRCSPWAVTSARLQAKPKRCVFSLLQHNVSVSIGSRSNDGREFHSFGAQAAKLGGPKLEVRQASTCKSHRAAEHTWRRLVLAVTGTYSAQIKKTYLHHTWRKRPVKCSVHKVARSQNLYTTERNSWCFDEATTVSVEYRSSTPRPRCTNSTQPPLVSSWIASCFQDRCPVWKCVPGVAALWLHWKMLQSLQSASTWFIQLPRVQSTDTKSRSGYLLSIGLYYGTVCHRPTVCHWTPSSTNRKHIFSDIDEHRPAPLCRFVILAPWCIATRPNIRIVEAYFNYGTFVVWTGNRAYQSGSRTDQTARGCCRSRQVLPRTSLASVQQSAVRDGLPVTAI